MVSINNSSEISLAFLVLKNDALVMIILLSLSIVSNKYVFDKTFFQEIDTEEKAYILGFIYADGNISNIENDKHYRIRILLKKSDSNILEKIKTAIKYTGPIHYRKSKYKNKTPPHV